MGVAEQHGIPGDPTLGAGAAGPLWRGADALLANATLEGVLVHKLGPLAAARMRRLGAPVPDALRVQERAALLGMRTGAALVERIREVYDGPLVLLKGPEVASLYPSRARRFGDIDVLTSDALGLYRALRERGFVEAPDDSLTDDHHHLEPLRWPTISLRIEVHSSPSWLPSMRPPSFDEIFEASVPSVLGIGGVSAPAPLHHTLILASHAWRDEPLQTLRDLVDVAAVGAAVGPDELDRTAAAWGLGRVWQTTWRAIEHLLYDGPPSMPLRSWARHLAHVRERSILEHHLVRWLSPYSELPPRLAFARMARVAREEIEPATGESWGDKLGRVASAMRNPSASVVRGAGEPERPEQERHKGAGS